MLDESLHTISLFGSGIKAVQSIKIATINPSATTCTQAVKNILFHHSIYNKEVPAHFFFVIAAGGAVLDGHYDIAVQELKDLGTKFSMFSLSAHIPQIYALDIIINIINTLKPYSGMSDDEKNDTEAKLYASLYEGLCRDNLSVSELKECDVEFENNGLVDYIMKDSEAFNSIFKNYLVPKIAISSIKFIESKNKSTPSLFDIGKNIVTNGVINESLKYLNSSDSTKEVVEEASILELITYSEPDIYCEKHSYLVSKEYDLIKANYDVITGNECYTLIYSHVEQ